MGSCFVVCVKGLSCRNGCCFVRRYLVHTSCGFLNLRNPHTCMQTSFFKTGSISVERISLFQQIQKMHKVKKGKKRGKSQLDSAGMFSGSVLFPMSHRPTTKLLFCRGDGLD